MSGFVEKLFDSFTGQDTQQQQQQQQQQVQRPWISQWDDREQRYVYINEETGERSWEVPRQGEFELLFLGFCFLFLKKKSLPPSPPTHPPFNSSTPSSASSTQN
jgi:hypothetical protein